MRIVKLYGFMKKVFGINLIILAMGLIVQVSTVYADSALRFGYDIRLTRNQTENISLPLKEKWSTKVTNPGTLAEPPILGQAAIIEDKQRIYQVAEKDIVELDFDGNILHRTNRVERESYPAVSSITYNTEIDTMYFGSRLGGVHSYSNDGKENWTYWHDKKVTSSVLEMDDKLVYGCADKKIVILDKMTGKAKTIINTEGEVTSSPSRIGQNVFLGVDTNRLNGVLYKINIEDNISYETVRLKSGLPSSITNDGRRLYFSDKAGRLYRVNSQTMKFDWPTNWTEGGTKVAYNPSYVADDTFSNNSPALYSDYAIFVLSKYGPKHNGLVVCVDANTGQTVWTKELQTPSYTSPIVWDTADLLLVADNTGIYGLDPHTGKNKPWFIGEDGQLVAKYTTKSKVVGELSLGGGMLLFSTIDGHINALGKGKDNLAVFGIWQGDKPIEPSAKCTGAVRVAVSEDISQNVTTPVIIKVDGQIVLNKQVIFEAAKDKPKQQVLEFNYTAPEDGGNSLIIEANINQDKSATYADGQILIERTYDDNSKTLTIPVFRNNLVVTKISVDAGTSLSTSQNTKVRINVKNEGVEQANTDLKLYQGNSLKNSLPISLASNEEKQYIFNWTAPAVQGNYQLKGIVNSNQTLKELNYNDNEKEITINVKANSSTKESSKLEISPTADPDKIAAGRGFTLTVETDIYSTDNKKIGPTWVKAKFANGETVYLEPTIGNRTNHDTWILPIDTKYNTGKRMHFIPEETPDGKYYIVVTAGDAGESRNLSETKTIYVTVEGSMYDGLGTHLIK